MSFYNASDWYWFVAGDHTRVYSSARASYVPNSDSAYQEWSAAIGALPTSIQSEDELTGVLLDQYPAGAPNRAASILLVGTIDLVCVSTPALNGSYSVTRSALDRIGAIQTGIVSGFGVPGGGSTFRYEDASGAQHEFTAQQFTSFAVAVRDYVYTITLIARGASLFYPSSTITIA